MKKRPLYLYAAPITVNTNRPSTTSDKSPNPAAEVVVIQ